MSKALTAASVEKLRADPSRRLEIPDGLLPGFYLVIQPSGKKSWAARYRTGGQPKKLTLGPYPALTLEEARAAARAALRDVQSGADPAAEKRQSKLGKKDRQTPERDAFEVVARLYLERYARPNTRSWRETARALGLVYDPARLEDRDDPRTFVTSKTAAAAKWHGRRIQEITRRDVLDLLDGIVDDGSPIAANRALAVIRKFFGWAAEREIIGANPVSGIKAPAAEIHRDRVLSDAELRAIWQAAEQVGAPFGAAVQLLILTGQRRDEVSGASWREIDLAEKLWTIPRGRAKNDVEHEVPLSATAIAILERVPKVAGEAKLVFTTTGETPISGWSRAKEALDRKALETLRKAAEKRGEDPAEVTLSDWRLHDLRRTAATGMARLGIDLPVIEKVLNHVSGSFAGIVGIYQRHSFADEKRRALDAWASFVTTLISGEPKGNVTPIRRTAE